MKKDEQKPPEAPAQETQPSQPDMSSVLKDIDSAMFALKFYPVAVNEQSKEQSVAKLEEIYSKGNDTVRQLLLYVIHETLATSSELKVMHTQEYFKIKSPAMDPQQLRVSVYRAMFNYNTSLEGLCELIRFLGRLKGGDDATKLLTYHFSHLCSYESETSHMLRAAILETLGKSESLYALKALLEYAHYSDNERTFHRIVSALIEWEGRIESLKVTQKEKELYSKKLNEIITSDTGGSHYG